jgi:hypothetical protein
VKWLCCTAAMLVREDGDDVDIIAIEQFAAIFEHFDGAFSDWRGPFFESSFASFFDVVAIDVADGGAVVKFMAWGPTASQRSPVPMQPSTGRSLGLGRGAAVDECANQYCAAAVASDARLADWRKLRRVGALVRLRGADDCFEVARGSCEDV